GGTPERGQFDCENRLCCRERHGQRIAVLVVEVEFVVKVGAAGPAGLPDVSDDFALNDAPARPQPQCEIPQVCVVRTVSLMLPEHDQFYVRVPLSSQCY